jgi:hypothetical protein
VGGESRSQNGRRRYGCLMTMVLPALMTKMKTPRSVPILPRNGSRRTPRSLLPTTLASLFASVVSNPITLTCRDRVVSEESLYMELLAAEHNDEEPDAGAQEGFGDDYDG